MFERAWMNTLVLFSILAVISVWYHNVVCILLLSFLFFIFAIYFTFIKLIFLVFIFVFLIKRFTIDPYKISCWTNFFIILIDKLFFIFLIVLIVSYHSFRFIKHTNDRHGSVSILIFKNLLNDQLTCVFPWDFIWKATSRFLIIWSQRSFCVLILNIDLIFNDLLNLLNLLSLFFICGGLGCS